VSYLTLSRPFLASQRTAVLKELLIAGRLEAEQPVWSAKKRQAGVLRCQALEGDLGPPSLASRCSAGWLQLHCRAHGGDRRSAEASAKAAEGWTQGMRLAVMN
jgi:hypothetical protein